MCAMIQQLADVADTLDGDNPFAAAVWEWTASADQRDILPEFLHPFAGHGDLILQLIIKKPECTKTGWAHRHPIRCLDHQGVWHLEPLYRFLMITVLIHYLRRYYHGTKKRNVLYR